MGKTLRPTTQHFHIEALKGRSLLTMGDSPSHAPPTMEYTRSQLALRNGQDRPEIWVAFRGIIYDVSNSRLWRDGKHYEHWAGQDLTEELAKAPHTDHVFERLEVVGRLKI